MDDYIVLYFDAASLPADPPLAFQCSADDTDHAEEQCLDAYPDCSGVAWAYKGTDVEAAYDDYWGN